MRRKSKVKGINDASVGPGLPSHIEQAAMTTNQLDQINAKERLKEIIGGREDEEENETRNYIDGNKEDE